MTKKSRRTAFYPGQRVKVLGSLFGKSDFIAELCHPLPQPSGRSCTHWHVLRPDRLWGDPGPYEVCEDCMTPVDDVVESRSLFRRK
jgi:hypothetical protein